MIIQCKQCRTKFRFDDAQMEGDGVWMRCSRCQHVFFQDNLSKINPSTVMPSSSSAFVPEPPPEKTVSRLSFEPASVVRKTITPDRDVTNFLRDDTAAENAGNDDLPTESSPVKQAGINLTDIEFSPASENPDEIDDLQEPFEETPLPPVRKKGILWKVALWSVFVILVVPALSIFVVLPQLGLPQYGERLAKLGNKYLGGSQTMRPEMVIGQVKLQDIRQRVVNNYILGNIRIVEGTAVNQADFSIARILIKAQVLDAYAVVLGERVSYAGNIISDEDLANLSEEEILRRLSQPEGRDNSNDRLIPNGQIPFMIVFTKDLPGTIKTTVKIYGAEKLL